MSDIERTATGLKFRVKDLWLPQTKAPAGTSELVLANRAGHRTLRVASLTGSHALRIDGREIDSFTADEWGQGIVGIDPPETDQSERLRRQIVAKNELLFRRWRRGSFKDDGSRDSREKSLAAVVRETDPIAASKDARIRELTVPATHVYELIQK